MNHCYILILFFGDLRVFHKPSSNLYLFILFKIHLPILYWLELVSFKALFILNNRVGIICTIRNFERYKKISLSARCTQIDIIIYINITSHYRKNLKVLVRETL